MMSPILSIETILSAMMCMCSSNSNSSYDIYSTLAEKIQYNQPKPILMVQADEIMEMKNKLSNIEKHMAEVRTPEVLQKHQCEAVEMLLGVPPLLECPRAITAGPNRIFNMKLPNYDNIFPVLCNGNDDYGMGWMIIQRRIDGSERFIRGWLEYRQGFGLLNGEFFIGLDALHAITTARPHELIIILENFERVQRFAKYERFEIGNATDGFRLNVLEKYSGNAGDSLSQHISAKFSTYDKANGFSWTNFAVLYTGAWWYYDETHFYSNLNGQYLGEQPSEDNYGQGITWDTFGGQYNSLKSVKMMIRPID